MTARLVRVFSQSVPEVIYQTTPNVILVALPKYTREQIKEIEHSHISDVLQGIVLRDERSSRAETANNLKQVSLQF
jgi:RNase H-fold protein (predicted Holliday junction resolvase)